MQAVRYCRASQQDAGVPVQDPLPDSSLSQPALEKTAGRCCLSLSMSGASLLSVPLKSDASCVGLLQGLRKVAIDELAKVEGDLQREAKEDAELKERHGSAWRRPSSTALNAKFLEKVAGRVRCHPVGALGGNPDGFHA